MNVAATEQTRARYPDAHGFVERDGVRIHWERYGGGSPAFLLLPTWEIVHSRSWKCQIPYLARHGTVVTFDPRGNGCSDRPRTGAEYARREYAGDAVAALDAAGVSRAVVVAWCDLGESLILAAEHPDRVAALIEIAPALQVGDVVPEPVAYPFDDVLDTDEGWAKENRHYWLRDWRGYAEFFFGEIFTEPHSTKQIEDAVGWALETDAETLLLSFAGWNTKVIDREAATQHARGITCPGLVVQGTEDELVEAWRGEAVARHMGFGYLSLEGSGHAPQARDPVRLNRVLRDAGRAAGAAAPARARRWTRGRSRPKRALYISSPIGLGHAWRDVAIADELRRLHPDLEIDWLAQDPVTRVLEARGERIHPASADLASESHHIASESADHDLHVFQAIRRMDEILIANFMVFHDLVEAEPYDVWIADEGWEIDYFLHENPELKTAAYCWLTDFVGWLPMPDGGEHEAFLTADLNAEMIEHIARYPRIRDRAIFLGNADDIVPDTFGPGLPGIREWTEQHFDFSGYVTGAAARHGRPRRAPGRAGLRAPRAGLHRDRRRLRRRASRCCATSWPRSTRRDGSCPTCAWSSSPARASTRRRSRSAMGSRCSPTSTSCGATSPPVTSRSSRAAWGRPWSWPPPSAPSSRSRSAITSSSSSTCAIGSSDTAPADPWTSPRRVLKRSGARSPRRSEGRWTIETSRPTAPPVLRR